MATVFLLRNDIPTACSRCRNYLSVPPISILNNSPVCGRCIPVCTEKDRAYFYEDVAKFMFFPCKNDINGCDIHLPMGKLDDHEANCNFMKILCPAINCETYIDSKKLLHHFKEEHEQLILKQNKYIFTQSNNDMTPSYLNRLFLWKDQVFIIQTRTRRFVVAFRVSCLDECTMNSLNFNLTINNKDLTNSISFNTFSIQRYSSKTPDFSKEEEISFVVLRSILGSDIFSTLTFSYKNKDGASYTNMDNNTVLSELECPICMNHMTPPIYMCTTGHSICNSCITKLPKCPSCSSGLSNTRNFSLEKISGNFTYNCKYKTHGCNFTENINGIEQHKKEYHIQYETSCFVKNIISCNWKGRFDEVYEHLITDHPGFCTDLIKTKVSFDLNIISMFTFIKYDKNIFKFSIQQDKNIENHEIGLNITFIENRDEKSDKYKFFLNIINGDRILTFSEICQAVPAASIVNNETDTSLDLRIPITLLKRFIDRNMLTFKLNLVKL